MQGGFARNVLVGILLEQLAAFSPFVLIALVAAYIFWPRPIQDRIILLPSADGSVGEVVVKGSSKEQVLNSPYAGVGADADGRLVVAEAETAKSVRERYGATLEALPPRPKSFTVYFAAGSATELDTVSRYVIEMVRSELAGRPGPEIRVIGHTDTVGGLEANDALSAERAATVRDLLVAAGIQAASMDVAGRGEREPAIPTADEVDEPRNRRVEISVR